MPLDVLIIAPSGPFGELIRLTLEADPAFRCTLIDKGEELRSAIQASDFQAVVFDCSISQPGPDTVAKILRAEYPSLALLFIPSESDTEFETIHSSLADGTISRPFDASLLPELINKAVQKRTDEMVSSHSVPVVVSEQTSVNTFKEEIQKTSAFCGFVIQNGTVFFASQDTGSRLQEQVVTAILNYWNPTDSSDLLRYIKDPESNQEWMMYATKMTDTEILALLFQPQTPVTKVRVQTVQLTRQMSVFNETKATPETGTDEEMPEFLEPPSLSDILGEAIEEKPERTSTGFPVEWFKEADLTDITGQNEIENPLTETMVPGLQIEPEFPSKEILDSDQFNQQENDRVASELAHKLSESIPAKQIEELVLPFSEPEIAAEQPEVFSAVENEVTNPTFNLKDSSPADRDLGSFQPVDLISETPAAAGLDSLQPVTLNSNPQQSMQPEQASDSPEIANPQDSDEEIPTHYQENAGQSPTETTADSDPGVLVIKTNEDLPFFEKIQLMENIPDDLTDTPDFENLPFFQSDPTNEIPVGEPARITTDNMEATQTPSGQVDFQAGGESTMENIQSDEEPENTQPDQINEELPGSAESDASHREKEEDLFSRMNQLQSAAKNEETETITVALVPHQEKMILQRQIASVLNQCMSRLCQAFGWKLENLTVRPTYMQWTVTIPNLFSPDDMVSIVRRQSTTFLLEQIPELQSMVVDEDLWAPESMMATGSEFAPSNHWQNFIFRRKNDEIA